MVVTARDTQVLLRSLHHSGEDVDEAVDRGVVAKVKVEGRWLYHSAQTSLERATSLLLDAAERVVSSWFIAPMPWLPGIACKQVGGITPGAGEALLHQLVRQQVF